MLNYQGIMIKILTIVQKKEKTKRKDKKPIQH